MYNKPILSTGILSELLKVHQRTLQIWDNEKILQPARSKNNRRLYSQKDLEKAKLIQYLTQNLALNLTGVKVVLELLQKLNIELNESIPFLEKIASKNNINEIENISKTSKRGRKPTLNKTLLKP